MYLPTIRHKDIEDNIQIEAVSAFITSGDNPIILHTKNNTAMGNKNTIYS